MAKIHDIFDTLWLNLGIIAGSAAILVGFLFGWNSCLAWQIGIAVYGAGIVCWTVIRFIRICRQGGLAVTDKEADFLVIRPEPNHNILKEFLQPVSFVIFVALSGSNWLVLDPEPRWFCYAILAILLLLAWLNLDYYRNRKN